MTWFVCFEGCEINVHKHCLESIRDICGNSPGVGGSVRKKRDKGRPSSVFGNIFPRKPSTNSPAASKLYFFYGTKLHISAQKLKIDNLVYHATSILNITRTSKTKTKKLSMKHAKNNTEAAVW